MRDEAFGAEVKRNVTLASIPDEWVERFNARILTWEKEISVGKQIQIDSLKAQMLELKLRIDRVNSGFTEGSLDSREFKELKNPLIAEKTGLEQKIIALETSKLNRLEPPFEGTNLDRHLQKTHVMLS